MTGFSFDELGPMYRKALRERFYNAQGFTWEPFRKGIRFFKDGVLAGYALFHNTADVTAEPGHVHVSTQGFPRLDTCCY